MRKYILVFFILFSQNISAQIPDDYYSTAQNKTGQELMEALYNTIKGHTELSYTGLWSAFYETDVRDDGKVWDMYSSCSFTFGDDQDTGSGGTTECEFYNREHSFPRSWFGGALAPMNTDLFHIYPTDKKVNSVRADYPYGNVASASYTSSNGSKLGSSATNGYSGTVFEPIDDYKGDFARSYFYMVTRYYNLASTWNCEMLNGTQHPAFTSWALNLLLEWHQSDPISLKEIERNNLVFANYQNNRNPFIDQPNYTQKVWVQESSPIDFSSSPIVTVDAENQYTYNISVVPSSSSTVEFTCLKKPEWLSLNSEGGSNAVLTGTPQNEDIGEHYIVIMANDGKSHAVQQFVVKVTQGGTEASLNKADRLTVYPNPTKSQVKIITGTVLSGEITIHNIYGGKIKDDAFPAGSTSIEIDVSELTPAFYILTISCKDFQKSTSLIVH